MGALRQRAGPALLVHHGLSASPPDHAKEPGELSRLVEIGRDVYAVLGGRGEANAGFVVGMEHVLVIDAKATPRMARALIAEIRRVTPRPIRFLVNTHFHGDHTFGNQVFAALQAVIVGQEQTRADIIVEGPRHLQGFFEVRKDLARDLEEVRLTPPSVTFDDHLELFVDERPVWLRHVGPAHSDGDILVLLPTERAVFAADLLFGRVTPALAFGNAPGWIRALDILAGLPVDTIVPGHGPLSTPADRREMRQYLVDLVGAVQQALQDGANEEEACQRVSMDEYRHWKLRERLPFSVRRTFRQLAGISDEIRWPVDAGR